jgi:hypothetical protein
MQKLYSVCIGTMKFRQYVKRLEMEFVKYGNRKYYARSLRRFATLKEIMNMRLGGQSVCIICHKTRNDITGATLARAALPRLEKALRHDPEQVDLLTDIVRKGLGV